MKIFESKGEYPESPEVVPYEKLPEVYVISNMVFNTVGPNSEATNGDGITVFGPGHKKCKAKQTLLRNVIIDFRNVPLEKQDEAISGVHGARISMENVVIIGAKKAMLCGNGDYPEIDALQGRWTGKNISFINCGRRCPEAQDGVNVSLCNVLVENWGEAFDVRNFAMWSHNNAVIVADGVVFYQNTLFDENFFKDLGNHIGQAFNEKDKKIGDYLTPGRCRASSATANGYITINDYYINSSLLRVQGKSGRRLGLQGGLDILRSITESYLKNQRFYSFIRAYCEGSVLLEGLET